jgi:hypothetical protein
VVEDVNAERRYEVAKRAASVDRWADPNIEDPRAQLSRGQLGEVNRQVGLLEDSSGRIKFTSWRKSGQPIVREGERVRLRAVAKNWYEGRCSVALTGKTRVIFPDRDEL